jgi:hypothetical protein
MVYKLNGEDWMMKLESHVAGVFGPDLRMTEWQSW